MGGGGCWGALILRQTEKLDLAWTVDIRGKQSKPDPCHEAIALLPLGQMYRLASPCIDKAQGSSLDVRTKWLLQREGAQRNTGVRPRR
jgi:hypothetical protein